MFNKNKYIFQYTMQTLWPIPGIEPRYCCFNSKRVRTQKVVKKVSSASRGLQEAMRSKVLTFVGDRTAPLVDCDPIIPTWLLCFGLYTFLLFQGFRRFQERIGTFNITKNKQCFQTKWKNTSVSKYYLSKYGVFFLSILLSKGILQRRIVEKT